MEEPALNIGIEQQVEKDQWSPEIMALAIAAKKKSRAQKDKHLNCFVLDRNNPQGSEVRKFFTLLHENINHLPDHVRFQLAVRVLLHWAAFDCEISKGKLSVFCLDSANDPKGALAMSEIHDIFPDASMYTYCVTDIPVRTGNVLTHKLSKIQFDTTSCSRFTLDHMFHLANIDTFKALSSREHKKDEFFHYVDINTMPPEMAHIFRNTQSWMVLANLPEHLKNAVVNKRAETLLYSALRHSDQAGRNKLINKAVDHKKAGFAQTIKDFIKITPPEEIHRIINERQGFSFIMLARLKNTVQKTYEDLSLQHKGRLSLFKRSLGKQVATLKELNTIVQGKNNYEDALAIVQKTSKGFGKNTPLPLTKTGR